MEYDNTNTGAVWKKRQSDKPNAPDLKITFNILGVDMSAAFWANDPGSNKPAYNIKIDEEGPKALVEMIAKHAANLVNAPSHNQSFNDDVPFL